MSDNVGLSTPRGSGTSGYVQRNRAFIRPRDNAYAVPSNPREALAAHQKQQLSNRPREPDQGILEHDRKRAIEVRVFELRDELEEKGELDEDAIDEKCDELRKKLTDDAQRNNNSNANANANGRQRFKAHQVHEQARAKQIESERLRRALRIHKDYEEGGHWRRQEDKQTLKRKQDDVGEPSKAVEPERKGRESDKRRRRYSDSSARSNRSDRSDRSGKSDGYSSYEEGEIRKGRRSPEPSKTVKESGGDARGRAPQRRSDSRSPLPLRARSASDSRSRSYSRTPSRSPSRSRSRARSSGGDKAPVRRRSPSYSRSRSRSITRSPSRSRSRSASRNSRA